MFFRGSIEDLRDGKTISGIKGDVSAKRNSRPVKCEEPVAEGLRKQLIKT